jgi:3-oxoacyl-[acyl-carrier protein] reductase
MTPARPHGSVHFDNLGRVVLVSGGASGIGLAVCQAFRNSGATVISLDVADPAAGADTKDIEFLKGDTSVETDCRKSVEQVAARHGGLDVLVNNAAIQPPGSYVPLHAMTTEIWQKLIAVNLSGYTYLAKHAVRTMLAQGSGVIVNIASAQGHRTAREVPAYGPAKAGNLLQTRQWGVEYARRGIRVVSVSPGAIRTPMVEASLAAQGGEAALAHRHPVGRLGKPEEVAAAVLWLSSPAASFVTATDLEVDGGLGAFGAFADPYPVVPKVEDEAGE